MSRTSNWVCRTVGALLSALAVAGGVTVEIRGRIENPFTEKQFRAVTVLITDRLGKEIGRTHPDGSGKYEIKISGPQFIIVKAVLEGHPDAIYQLDTKEYRESTTDREHNAVFGELRIQTYHQNIVFGEKRRASADSRLPALDELLAGEDPRVIESYKAARRQKEAGELDEAVGSLGKLIEEHPDFYLGHIDLGMILAAQQENDRATQVFERALRLRPEHPWGHVGLGVALNSKQDFKAAAQHLDKLGPRHRRRFARRSSGTPPGIHGCPLRPAVSSCRPAGFRQRFGHSI